MELCASRGSRVTNWLALTAFWAVLLAGCNQQPSDSDKVEAPDASVKQKGSAKSPVDDPLHQPFLEAVLVEPPDGQLRPPDKTKAGKYVATLYEAIVGQDGVGGLWDKVKFVTPAGKRVNYAATIKTDLGNIRIEFFPDIAPNHVRNFVALAMAGYYDGLEFDRTVHEEFADDKGTFLDYIQAGCPLGTGDPSYGSIGYWLKPELCDKIQHEAGTVGAWHAEELESAACKFYITLDKAPWMGNWTAFGKVTQGLDVARAIHALPVRRDEKDRPEHPVVIRAVTIDRQEEGVSSLTAGP